MCNYELSAPQLTLGASLGTSRVSSLSSPGGAVSGPESPVDREGKHGMIALPFSFIDGGMDFHSDAFPTNWRGEETEGWVLNRKEPDGGADSSPLPMVIGRDSASLIKRSVISCCSGAPRAALATSPGGETRNHAASCTATLGPRTGSSLAAFS
jgi:hypothetical protein